MSLKAIADPGPSPTDLLVAAHEDGEACVCDLPNLSHSARRPSPTTSRSSSTPASSLATARQVGVLPPRPRDPGRTLRPDRDSAAEGLSTATKHSSDRGAKCVRDRAPMFCPRVNRQLWRSCCPFASKGPRCRAGAIVGARRCVPSRTPPIDRGRIYVLRSPDGAGPLARTIETSNQKVGVFESVRERQCLPSMGLQ